MTKVLDKGYNTAAGYVTIVYVFEGGEVSKDQMICGTGTPTLFTSSAEASGLPIAGYQWQQSSDNNNWVDINGAEDLTYQAPTVNQTTYYRRKATATNAAIAYSNTITITVNPIPAFDKTGFAKTVCNNQDVTLELADGGNFAGITYDWTNENPALGLAASGNNSFISFTGTNNGATTISGTITVTPTAAGCAGTSQSFVIAVKPTPTVAAIADQALCHNTNSTAFELTGAVAGTTYSWTNSAASIGLAASGTGNIPAFTAVNTGNTPVVATIKVVPEAEGCTGAEQTFTITVNPLPQASINGGSFCKIGTQQLAVTNGPTTGTFSAPAGLAINASGLIDLVASTPGTYTVTYTFSNGTCSNTATSSVEVKELTSISTQPASQTVCEGTGVRFSVVGKGEGTLAYQWRKNGNVIVGATTATIEISNAAAAHAGNYDVVVTGACGSVISAAAVLTVNAVPAAPAVTASGATIFCDGNNVTLTSSAATGNQWYKNGVAITGATGKSYTATTSGSYAVLITQNGCSSALSAVTIVNVKPLPAVPVISKLSTNVLSSSATAYNQWYLNGAAIANATYQTYRVQSNGVYIVKVTDNGCTSTSAEHNFVATRIDNPSSWNGEITVYPNPVQKVLFIKNTAGRKLQVQLFDVFGKKVYESKLVASEGSISVEKWASGVYQLVITDLGRNETISQSIIKF
jgi:hypothetical protein